MSECVCGEMGEGEERGGGGRERGKGRERGGRKMITLPESP